MLTPSDTSGERRGKRSSRKSRKRRKPCWLNCNKPIQLHDTRTRGTTVAGLARSVARDSALVEWTSDGAHLVAAAEVSSPIDVLRLGSRAGGFRSGAPAGLAGLSPPAQPPG